MRVFEKIRAAGFAAAPPDGLSVIICAGRLFGLVDDFNALFFQFGFFADNAFSGDGFNHVDHVATLGSEFPALENGPILLLKIVQSLSHFL